MGQGRGTGGLSPASAAIVLGVAVLWGALTTIIWAITVIIVTTLSYGGPGFSLLALGFVIWGVLLGSLAGGLHVVVSLVLGRLVPRVLRDIVGALLGWGVALAVWAPLAFNGSDLSIVIGSFTVAILGAGWNFLAAQKRQGRV